MTTWSRAMPRLLHSWEKSQHKHVRGLNVNTAYQGEKRLTASIFGLWERGLPEEEGQGLEKGLEVVVMIYCRFLTQLYVSKHLRQQESRWLNWNLQTKTTALLLLQSITVANILGVKLTHFRIPLIPCTCLFWFELKHDITFFPATGFPNWTKVFNHRW